MEEEIKKILIKIIKNQYNLDLKDIKLEVPPKKELGDFAFGCFILSKKLKKSPINIATELLNLAKNEDIISDLNTAGPYLNIKTKKTKKSIILEIKKLISLTGIESQNNKTIIIDYIGANVGKPLHIGHMCTPNQGQAMINAYKQAGFNVISDSHIGDWGIIFGKLITAYKLWGEEEKLKNNAVEYLLELYIKITAEGEKDKTLEQKARDEFKLLSSGNSESKELWAKFTGFSISAMNEQLARINVFPDYNIGESFYEGIGLPKLENYPDLKHNMSSLVDELIEKNIATKNDDNSVGVVFSDELKLPSCILQKRDGAHGYLASDLTCIKYRMHSWSPNSIIYFVDVRQQLHFKQAFEIAKQAGWIKKQEGETKLIHAYNGFISGKDGAFSTRKGNIIRLSELLDQAEQKAKNLILTKRDNLSSDELEKLSKIIGIGAIKYGYLKKKRTTDVIFDWDEFMSFEGNSGPYIQYAYVRAKRILEKNSTSMKNESSQINNNSEKQLSSVQNLVKILLKYNSNNGILNECIEENMPHIIANYSYELTKAFNDFYNNVQIITEKDDLFKDELINLIKKFMNTIEKCFAILGIELPEQM